MMSPVFAALLFAFAGGLLMPFVARADFLDQDGVTWLRLTTTNLNGAGLRVAQPEDAADSGIAGGWLVDPAQVGQRANLFTYASTNGSINTYPNALGTNSPHGVYVGQKFYGKPYGIATNVTHVDNFESGYFYNHYVAGVVALNDAVVSQSYTFGPQSAAAQQQFDTQFDNYADRFKTLFVSAVDNFNGVHAPATCYNGIGVAAYGTPYSSIGPTVDNGRCKPDICAPDYVTSFSTPQVAGVAVLLMQAALRGDGGNDTNSAFDLRTVKALLLNGAVKPADWTNASFIPLDARYGAGKLNALNSYRQLAGGRRSFTTSQLVSSGGAHLPVAFASGINTLSAWDFSTNTSDFATPRDGVNHYFLNATNGTGSFNFTATLVWHRHTGQTNINNLDLFLYNCANSNLVVCSTSRVDNVEHVFVRELPPGRYDLQVWKSGGAGGVSPAEPYALAFQFAATKLSVTKSGSGLTLTWPAYPDGYVAETSTNPVDSTSWSSAPLPAPIFTNGNNLILLGASETARFYRLHQP